MGLGTVKFELFLDTKKHETHTEFLLLVVQMWKDREELGNLKAVNGQTSKMEPVSLFFFYFYYFLFF